LTGRSAASDGRTTLCFAHFMIMLDYTIVPPR
jgi:hypothetical protein